MVHITRFNPLEGVFDNWIRSVPVWLPSPETGAPTPTQFCMDVTENDKEYQVLVDLPGVKKEEISITISGNEVAGSAEVKHEKDVENGETVLRAERYYGTIERAFPPGHAADGASRRKILRQGRARVRAWSGGGRCDRPSQLQRRRAGNHAAEESRIGGK